MVILKLQEVRKLKFQIKNLEDKIKELKSYIEVQSVKYSEVSKVEGFKNSVIELHIQRLIELETKKDRLQMKIDMILEELAVLPELVYKVVYCRHVDGMRWEEVSKSIGYSVAQCHRYYRDAINTKI